LPKGTTCVPGIAGCHRQPKNPIGILHLYDQGINGNFCLSCTRNIQTHQQVRANQYFDGSEGFVLLTGSHIFVIQIFVN
jgi:hypothetical protein